VSAPASLAAIAAATESVVTAAVDTARRRWTVGDDELAEPFDEIDRFVAAGGKRIRAAFCHWAFVGAGGDPADPVVGAAGAAFELMQAFALLHDDVIDDAMTRRGESTTHAMYAAQHAADGLAGEARRFGEGVAILVGDLAAVLADELLVGTPPAVRRLWNELRIELTAGQYLDVVGTARRQRDLAAAQRIGRLKSGKYTVERPLHVGALLAGRSDLLAGLSRFGLPLGDAFQLRDDVIGAFGDPAVTGKPVGVDLLEGKPTPLLARAVAMADTAQRVALDRVGTPELRSDGLAAVHEVQAAIVDCGALAAVEAEITRLHAESSSALAALGLAAPAPAELVGLADFVIARAS
jgi:geranylgeranyl diphosphate synthase, type I